MNRSRLSLAIATMFIAACASPPKPPTVDDSRKRPVNVSQTVDLQACRTELTATQIVLTESLTTQRNNQVLAALAQATAAGAAAPGPAPTPTVMTTASPNQVFIVNFPLGSSDFNLPAEQGARLLEQARAAKFILIRGRTDAATDSMSETRLAQRRAEAAYRYLVELVRLPGEGIRLSWQGAGDPLQPVSSSFDKQANRRVEIELYQVRPETHVLTLPDPSRQAGI